MTEAREQHSGFWSDKTFDTRGNMVGVWLARIEGAGDEVLAVRRAYAAWLDRLQSEAGDRASEMLCRMAFWVTTCELPTGDEGLRMARRALELATTLLDYAKARTQIGYALSCLRRYAEAEAVLAAAIAHAPDGPARWQAQYHHAYIAHVEGKKDVQIARYLSTFEAIAAGGALATDLGWTVATDLVGFLLDAEDVRAVDVQHAYCVALARELGVNDPQTVASRRKLRECRHVFATPTASGSRGS